MVLILSLYTDVPDFETDVETQRQMLDMLTLTKLDGTFRFT